MHLKLCFTLLMLTGLFLITPVQAATTFTVTRFDDPLPDACLPGDCSLREAVLAANTEPGADTITLPAGNYILSRAGNDNTAFNGDLDITNDITLQGAGANETIIDGNGDVTQDRVLHILPNITGLITGVTLTGGKLSGNAQQGGGIDNRGFLTISHSVISGNSAEGFGGGLHNEGALTLLDSLISDNSGGSGGGLSNGEFSNLVIRRSQIRGNTTTGHGGGLYSATNEMQAFLITDSTISGNSAEENGGGIAHRGGSLTLINSTLNGNLANDTGGGLATDVGGTVKIINSTVSDNRVNGIGGGLYNVNNSLIELYNVTVAGNIADNDDSSNSASNGGGIFNEPNATVVIRNSLIGGNVNRAGAASYSPDDCNGIIIARNRNLVETISNCLVSVIDPADLIAGQNPELEPLGDNGGLTQTQALNASSPAIDAGDPTGCVDGQSGSLTTDQRGYQRPVDGGSGQTRCDIGAFEFGATAPASPEWRLYLPLIRR